MSPADSIPENLRSQVPTLEGEWRVVAASSPNVWAGWSAAPLGGGGIERICVDGLGPGARTRDIGGEGRHGAGAPRSGHQRCRQGVGWGGAAYTAGP